MYLMPIHSVSSNDAVYILNLHEALQEWIVWIMQFTKALELQ